MPIANPDAIKAREQWLQHNSLVTSLLGLHGRWTAVSPGVLIGIADHDHHPDHQYFVRRTEAAALRGVTGGLMARPGSGGDVDAAHPGGADVQPRHVSRQAAPGLNKAIQGTDGTQCRTPDKEIDRPGPRVGPLQPGCHHTRTRLEVLQHIGNRLRATQHVVREVKQRGIGMPRPAR